MKSLKFLGGACATAMALMSFVSIAKAEWVVATSTPTTTIQSSLTAKLWASSTCPVIKHFMKLENGNDQEDVRNLQMFLKNNEGADVEVNGKFDTKTDQAVKNFQEKYVNDVLAPWGGSLGSGIVNITTSKKINQIACGHAITLSEDELVVINEFKAKKLAKNSGVTLIQGGSASSTKVVTIGPKIGSDDKNVKNTASAANAVKPTMIKRLWNFIWNLF